MLDMENINSYYIKEELSELINSIKNTLHRDDFIIQYRRYKTNKSFLKIQINDKQIYSECTIGMKNNKVECNTSFFSDEELLNKAFAIVRYVVIFYTSVEEKMSKNNENFVIGKTIDVKTYKEEKEEEKKYTFSLFKKNN